MASPLEGRTGRARNTGSDALRDAAHFHMVSSNVLRPNTRYVEVIDAVLKSDPDVIGFLEFSPEWKDSAIERLELDYPHHVEAPNTDGWSSCTWGLMLFSKTELTSSKVLPVPFDDWALRPVLQATIAEPLQLTITLAHPERPGRPVRMRARRLALQTIAASDVEGDWLVIGDLNTTYTSPLLDVGDAREDSILPALKSASIESRVPFGPRAGQPLRRLLDPDLARAFADRGPAWSSRAGESVPAPLQRTRVGSPCTQRGESRAVSAIVSSPSVATSHAPRSASIDWRDAAKARRLVHGQAVA